MASTWGLRRPTSLRDRNGQFWMLWPLTYHAGYGYRPVAGDTLKVWDGEGNVYAGTIMDVRSFLYSCHAEVKLALGGVAEWDAKYLEEGPPSGRCTAVRGELTRVDREPCPIEGQQSWKDLT